MEGGPVAKRQQSVFDKMSRDDLERALGHASTLVALLAFEASRWKVDMDPLRDFVDPHVQGHLAEYKELQRQYNEPAALFGEAGPELRRQMIACRKEIEAYFSTFRKR